MTAEELINYYQGFIKNENYYIVVSYSCNDRYWTCFLKYSFNDGCHFLNTGDSLEDVLKKTINDYRGYNEAIDF